MSIHDDTSSGANKQKQERTRLEGGLRGDVQPELASDSHWFCSDCQRLIPRFYWCSSCYDAEQDDDA